MRCRMSYSLPCSPQSSPVCSGPLLRDRSRCMSACESSPVVIANKIEQAMDLVKGHLMVAVREELEMLREQLRGLYERNSLLRQENALLKSCINSQQLMQLAAHFGDLSRPLAPQAVMAAVLQVGNQAFLLQASATSA